MKRKAQIHWAIVGRSGYINYGKMGYTRRGVIEQVLGEFSAYRDRHLVGLTDAQCWRKLKKRYGWSIRRVSLRVVK